LYDILFLRMSIFPITPLVGRVQRLIVQTFDVPEKDAENCAAEMVSLAEGWGSPAMAEQLDWSYRIKKDLGDRLRWKSDADREAFQKQEEEKYKAYDFLIKRPNRA